MNFTTRLGYWLQNLVNDPETRAKTIGTVLIGEAVVFATTIIAIVLWVTF